jgi:hypothetical protein
LHVIVRLHSSSAMMPPQHQGQAKQRLLVEVLLSALRTR